MKRTLALLLTVLLPATARAGVIYQPAAGITFGEAGGLLSVEPTGITFGEAGGFTFGEAGGITFGEAGGITFGEAGVWFSNPTGFTFGEAGGITFGEAGGITFGEAGGITFGEAGSALFATPGGITFGEAGSRPAIDLELLQKLSVADTSSLNVIITYRTTPGADDFDRLRFVGVAGGTVLRNLPMVIVDATKSQVRQIDELPNIRSIYLSKNTSFAAVEDQVFAATASTLPETTPGGQQLDGRGIGVAVVDTGIDTTHPDLADGRVHRNVVVSSPQGTSIGFVYPTVSGDVPDSDLVYGHGTAVAGVIAGSGKASDGRVLGLAQGAHLIGISTGQTLLLNVLEGFDSVLSMSGSENIRIVNCSFSSSGLFDPDDPVNIATKAMADRGMVVVMAAGNYGPGPGSISPYAVAPWVIGVAATSSSRRLADFSSRGYFASALYAPTVAAPGVGVIAPRASGAALMAGGSAPFTSTDFDPTIYAAYSGTSFSAPIVSALVARILQANPSLSPSDVKRILQETATPSPRYDRSEIGAGVVNYVAAIHSALDRRIDYGSSLRSRYYQADYTLTTSSTTSRKGTLQGSVSETFDVAAGTANIFVTLGWGPQPSANDLDLYVYGPDGVLVANSASLNMAGLMGATEGVNLRDPVGGRWRAEIRAKGVATTDSLYTVVFESNQGNYPTLDPFSPADRVAMQTYVRSGAASKGSRLTGSERVDRLALARAFVAYGQPKFLPGSATFKDVPSDMARLLVESSAGPSSLGGPLFGGYADSSSSTVVFSGNSTVTRIEFCRAIVRFAGLQNLAAERFGASLPLEDLDQISAADRGYVSVALEKNLIDTRPGALAPRLEGGASLSTLTMARALSNSF